ncbi:ATP-binding protein [Thalassotalea fusca]
MSLRQYLFALVGGLIIVLTIVQVVLIFWLQHNIDQDVQNKVRTINEQAFELALDEVGIKTVIDAHHGVALTEKIKQDDNTPEIEETKEVEQSSVDKPKVRETIKIVTFNSDVPSKPIIELKSSGEDSARVIEAKHLKKVFDAQIELLLKEKVPNSAESSKLVIQQDNAESKVWVSSTVNDGKIKQLLWRVQLILILGGAIALTFAYWLSVTFNQPLKALVNGFEQLSKGNYDHRVEELGVSELKTTIKRFNLMGEQLAQLSQAEKQHKEIAHLAELGEVSRGLAHALRSPIHTIGLSLEQLLDQSLSSEQRNLELTRIQQKISHIDKSIKSLLTLTTYGINRDETCPLLAIVQDIVLEYKSSQAKVIQFEIDVDKNLTLKGAESEIRSIFHTLIFNACEASSENQIVKIALLRSPNQLQFTVTDSGSGLAANIASQLFKPHVSSKPDGAGMGLYIARRIIQLHYHGDLALENIMLDDQVTGCKAYGFFALQETN